MIVFVVSFALSLGGQTRSPGTNLWIGVADNALPLLPV